MPKVQEVFDMATQKVRPELDSLEAQHRHQRQHAVRQKVTVFVLTGALVAGVVAFGVSTLRADENSSTPLGPRPTPSSAPAFVDGLPAVGDGPLKPGRYVIQTLDPQFDATHLMTIDVHDGYSGYAGKAVLADAQTGGDTGVSVWVVRNAYTDTCHWQGTETSISSADELASVLVDQEALQPSNVRSVGPVTGDGSSWTRIHLTTPDVTEIQGCDSAQLRIWGDPSVADDAPAWVQHRYLSNPGQDEYVYIADVDGAVLVIDASVGADAPFENRIEAELYLRQSIEIRSRD